MDNGRAFFRAGDRVVCPASGRTGYVRRRRHLARLGVRYLVEWEGGLDYSLARPAELEHTDSPERGAPAPRRAAG